MNYKGEILEIRKQRRVSVAKLSEITQIPVDRIYKWESGVGNPKADDSEKLRKWLDNLEVVQEPEPAYNSREVQDKTIYNLSEANIILAKAVYNLSEKVNSGAPVEASSSLTPKGKVSTDPTEVMQQGKQGKSVGKKDSGHAVGK